MSLEEDGPISQLLRQIITDPATTKLVTCIISGSLIGVATNINREWNEIPLLIIFISSLIYSILTLLIVVLKHNVTNCGLLKKVFGSEESFMDFQSAMAMLFAMANISGIFLVWATYNGVTLGIGSFINVVFFLTDWYVTYRAAKKIEHDLLIPENEYSCCTKCIFGAFKKCPIFFNFMQAAFLIESITLTIHKFDISCHAGYYYFCTGFTIVCLILHTALQFSKKLCEKVFAPPVPSHKWQKYFLIIIALYSFLAIIALAPIHDEFILRTKEKVFGDPAIDGFIKEHKYFDFYDQPTTPPKNDTRPFYYKTIWKNTHVSVVSDLPVALALSTLAFLLSLFRLHPFAMPSSKQEFAYENEDNNSHEPLQDDTQATDVIIEKFNNLPTVIEFLQNVEEIKKPPTILM